LKLTVLRRLAPPHRGDFLKERVVLILHGFAGSRREIETLDEYLKDRGFDTYAPLLSGHGKSRAELGRVSHGHWLRDAERAYEKLDAEYKTITLIGFSMGGLLCAGIAGKPKVDRVVFINTPIYVWNVRVIARNLVNSLRGKTRGWPACYFGGLKSAGLKSAVDFLRLLSAAKPIFSRLDKPALILQCVDDETVWPESAVYIKRQLGGPAELKLYRGGCHQVLNGGGESLKRRIFKDIYRFVKV
jgi:carboxylesterase